MLFSSLLLYTACWSRSYNSGKWGIRWGSPQVHRASPDYITAFILTNGISWWGIPRVMGIKIPGLPPTRHLPSGAQQICCTCCCSHLYTSGFTKRPQELDTCVYRLSEICLFILPLHAELEHFCLYTPWPSWIWHRLQPYESVSYNGEQGITHAHRQSCNVSVLACSTWMTLLDRF